MIAIFINVSPFAALALMILVPTCAGARRPRQAMRWLPNIQRDAGLFCQGKALTVLSIIDTSGACARVLKFCPRIFRQVCGCGGKTKAARAPTPCAAAFLVSRPPPLVTARDRAAY
jgi:hypothetical protein